MAGEEFGGGFVGGVLGDEAAGDGGGEDGFAEAFEALAGRSERGLAGVKFGECLLDRPSDPLLLGAWRHGDGPIGECRRTKMVNADTPRASGKPTSQSFLPKEKLVKIAIQFLRNTDSEQRVLETATCDLAFVLAGFAYLSGATRCLPEEDVAWLKFVDLRLGLGEGHLLDIGESEAGPVDVGGS